MVKRVADPDRGPRNPRGKDVVVLPVEEDAARRDARDGLRDLDSAVENMTQLNRMQKDRERNFARDTTADLRDPRMRRQLPAAAEVRRPLSARQRNDRSKTRRETLEKLPQAQVVAQASLITNDRRWMSINDVLSDGAGDIHNFSDAQKQYLKRVDRSIQAYERNNERGHVVYTAVKMPPYINNSNFEGFVRNQFFPGRKVAFDRYTQATHQLHETAGHADQLRAHHVVFEMQTRRGAYMGRSDKVDKTNHLLPRGLEFEVVGQHTARYQRPDGTIGTKTVVQLRDITPDT